MEDNSQEHSLKEVSQTKSMDNNPKSPPGEENNLKRQASPNTHKINQDKLNSPKELVQADDSCAATPASLMTPHTVEGRLIEGSTLKIPVGNEFLQVTSTKKDENKDKLNKSEKILPKDPKLS